MNQIDKQIDAGRMRSQAAAGQKAVSLALQGGGAHGAFGWGVLDALLEDGRLGLCAISATSAGAMNAVVLADGFAAGGAEGARAKLEEFWREVARAGEVLNPLRAFSWESWLRSNGVQMETSFGHMAMQAMTQMWSPYQLNPMNYNPLREILERVVDFRRLARSAAAPRLYLSATNVRTGKIKVFENADVSADVVLASACLPHIFQTVEIDGEPYWDGGFMGNPAIFPLIYNSGSRDILIVHINPIVRDRVPRTAPEIFDRMNEISFNSSLMREMRAVAFVTKLIDAGVLDAAKYARMLIHSIRDDAHMAELGVGSKLDPDWQFLCTLRDAGRARAMAWLEGTFDDVGVRSSVDLAAAFL